MIHAAAVALALALPWLTAVLWLRLLFPEPAAGRWPLLVGYGYLLGMLGVTLLLRLQAALGLGLGWWLPLLALTALAVLAWRRARQTEIHTILAHGHGFRPWFLIAMALLVALIGARLLTLALELWWLPLYPWDAWTTWAVRAKVWTAAGDLVPFVAPENWLIQPHAAAYSIRAWDYPPAVSLLAAWPVLAFGSWNETVANLPWLGCVLALVLAFYGQARRWGAAALTTLVCLWLLVSLPMLNTHVALAGYADLWLATALGLAFFAFLHWVRDGDRRQAGLALVAALAALLIKQEGLIWVLLFLPALALARLRPVWLLGLAVAGVLGIWSALPLLSAFPLAYSGVWTPLMQHLFLLDNWHFLPVLLAAALVAASMRVVRDWGDPALRAGLVWVLGTLTAIYLLFFWTPASEWVRQGTSVNRILLQFAPAWLFWMLTVWQTSGEQTATNA